MEGREQSPRTIGRALDELEVALFVDRTQELDSFRRWLDEPDRPILNVVGRGGMGKSTLLRAFARQASGRHAVPIDADEIGDSPEDLMNGLGPAFDPSDQALLLLIDSYARAPRLSQCLQDSLLPGLADGAKVVIAGRIPLGHAWQRWRALTRTMTLDVLPPDECRRYLLRRGVTDRKTIETILGATAGLPLALSLAADIVLELGTVDLGATTEWRQAVRSLVDHLIHDIADPELVTLLEACAMVHHFDEPTLQAMTGRDDVSSPFARLCSLSIVRATSHGLTLHADVRSAVADDLRWRNPELHAELRERALEHLRERMSHASREERHWLSSERMYLWENAFLHSVLFSPTTDSEIVTALARPDEIHEAILLERRYQDEVLPIQSRVGAAPLSTRLDWLEEALCLEGARVMYVRDVRGRLTGYTLMLPLYKDAVAMLRTNDVHMLVIDNAGEIPVANTPEAAIGYYLVRLCVIDQETEATTAALVTDTLGMIAREGVFMTVAAVPMQRQLLETLRFERIDGASGGSTGTEFQGYVLDLRGIGFDAWVDALMQDRALVRPPRADELERELTELLPVLDDDERVAESSIGRLAGDASGARTMVRSTLESLRSTASSDIELALRALELAYIERAAAHERIAERLSVSRSTFYRLLRRGTRALAEALSRSA